MLGRWVLCPLALASALTATAAMASPADLCRAAAARAAARHDVPEAMLQAIALVESRRTVDGQSGPWPWTLNIAGEGVWLADRRAALARARAAVAAGQTSVDLGCFQLNYRWHGRHFDSLDVMIDPEPAADYAARFLAELYAETGDWVRAAGYYHSRTPRHFRPYRARVARALAQVGPRSRTEPEGPGKVAEAQSAAEPPGPRRPPPGAVAMPALKRQPMLRAGGRLALPPPGPAPAPRGAGGVALTTLAAAGRLIAPQPD